MRVIAIKIRYVDDLPRFRHLWARRKKVIINDIDYPLLFNKRDCLGFLPEIITKNNTSRIYFVCG